jgi:LacI family transcriptional regulator
MLRAVNRFGRDRITIADVASASGVSKTTVSHVLSGKRPVALLTRERVERMIEELGYRPNSLARSLRTNRTHTVALVVPNITNPYYPVLARGMEDTMAAGGYRTFLCNTDDLAAREREFLHDLMARRVDGIAISSFHLEEPLAASIAESGTPVVSIGERLDHPLMDSVVADDERGAYDATMRLVEGGSARLALIEGTPGSGQPRSSGFRRALAGSGIAFDPQLARPGFWTRQGGAEAMRVLLSMHPRPDGVFCENDLMAIGAMDVAHDLGLRVPDDLALIGFDDIEAAALVTPALTTVLNPAYEEGRVAAEFLLSRIGGGYEGPSRSAMLPCTLILRASA